MKTEYIECAAITHFGKVYALARPARHHDIIGMICYELKTNFVGSGGQGFLTNRGRFVDRLEGEMIARLAGQVDVLIGSVLTSEDMW